MTFAKSPLSRTKPRKCPECHQPYVKRRAVQPTCGALPCQEAYAIKVAAKEERKRARLLPLPKKAKAKAKKSSLPALIRKADEITSRHIRTKHADENGNVKCVSCPTVLPWKDAHCAHSIGRAKKATRWLEENLHPACPSCNVFRKEFHMREYTLFMEDFYGRKFVDELRELEKKVCTASQVRQMAEDAIRDYAPLKGAAE